MKNPLNIRSKSYFSGQKLPVKETLYLRVCQADQPSLVSFCVGSHLRPRALPEKELMGGGVEPGPIPEIPMAPAITCCKKSMI